MSSIAKSTVTITLFNGAGMMLGFLSNMVVASSFGAGREMDIFLSATTIPLFITGILASVLNFTFIPVYTEYRAKAPEELRRVAGSIINLNLLLTLGLCLTGMIFARPLMAALTPGFDEAAVARSALLLRLLLPTVVFSALNELFASIYYANRSFLRPSLNKIVSPLAVILFVVFSRRLLDTVSIALAMNAAAALQAALLVSGLRKHGGFEYRFTADLRHPGVRQMLALMAPLAAGMLIYRAGPIVDRYFLSSFPAGCISHIGYAMKLISVFPAIIVPGISLPLFPVMSADAAENRLGDLRFIMAKGLKMMSFICVPVVVFLGVFGMPVIQTVFERGLFNHSDTVSVYRVFLIYLLALPAICLGSVIGQGYYIYKDTRTPALLGTAAMLLYIAVCVVLIPMLGYLAIPVSSVVYYNAAALVDCVIIRAKMGNAGGRTIAASFAKHMFAAALAAAALAGLIMLLSAFAAPPAALKTALLPLGFLAYFLLCRDALKTEEAQTMWHRLWTSQQDRLHDLRLKFRI